MKLYASRENLLHGVNIVQRAVATKNPLPILSGMLITAEDNTLKFTATDLEMGIECTVPVTVVEQGSVVVSARYFSEVVRRLPDIRIELEVNPNNHSTNIRYGQSEISIHGMSPEDFPILPQLDREKSVTINGSLFRNMIKQVAFAASSDNSRPIFTGVLLEINGEQLKLVATDTHRLAFRSGKIASSQNLDNLSVIIPGKTISEISKITGEDSQVQLTFTENQVLFEIDNICLISRLINGQFPNYNQVVPQGYKSRIRVKSKDFLESMERASLMTKEGSSVVKISIEELSMNITSNSPDIGRIYEQVQIYLEGEETSISFNSRYLLDVLKVADDEEVYLELTDSLSPGIVKPVGNENYLYLILPIRTL
ncbi:MAG: DNA polymerase III subunit beta [Clostridia bacterium]|nr:DNA polymerase III subunit beta [Clostridia bacterium]